jgi:hypothetical protein
MEKGREGVCMFEKVTDFLGVAAMNLGAVAVLWVLLTVSGYAIARWCIKQEISWQRVVRWISVAMAIVFGSVALLYILPPALTAPMTKVLVPNLICAAALHALLLAIDRYMRHRYGDGIIQTRLVVAIIVIYVVAILGSIALMKLNYLTIMQLSDIATGYLTRTAIMGLLALEILGGRCKDTQEDGSSSNSNYGSRRW